MAFPTTAANIERAEEALKRSLPASLRERLLRNNGGDVIAAEDEWHLPPVWDETNRRTIARTTNHIVHETRQARDWANFPAGAIAVAGNGTGDCLVLRSGSDDVEFWDHETGECTAVTVDWNDA